jgi:Cft2 family RNA processing exonuclease
LATRVQALQSAVLAAHQPGTITLAILNTVERAQRLFTDLGNRLAESEAIKQPAVRKSARDARTSFTRMRSSFQMREQREKLFSSNRPRERHRYQINRSMR